MSEKDERQPQLFNLPQEAPNPSGAPEGDLGVDWVVESVMYNLYAPMIGCPGWEDVVSTHKDRIILTRLLHGVEIAQSKQATELETMLYLSSASLTAPMQSHWVDIYLHLFHCCFGDQPAVDDLPARTLTCDQVVDLARLRRWIYDTQVKHLKARGQPEKGHDPDVVAEEVQQFKLFE